MAWRVDFHPAFLGEFETLSEAVQDEIAALIKLLGVFGPRLGRPRCDTLNGSKHANMKALRFDADDGVWHLAFACSMPSARPFCWWPETRAASNRIASIGI
jgi:hypothetical protein